VSGIQLIAAVFAVAMMYQTFLNFKRNDLGVGGLLFWQGLWGGLLLITLLPGVFQRLNNVVHVARLLDLVAIGGLLLLAGLTYQLHIAMRRLRRAVDALVRGLALRDLPSEMPPP
jgi:hypothetical protein